MFVCAIIVILLDCLKESHSLVRKSHSLIRNIYTKKSVALIDIYFNHCMHKLHTVYSTTKRYNAYFPEGIFMQNKQSVS